MSNEYRPVVWIVFGDGRKDFSRAEIYGDLKEIFSSVGKNYNGAQLIDHARFVLQQSEPTDYILMVGDPALCAVCTTAMVEIHGGANLLRWDREKFQYFPLELDFS